LLTALATFAISLAVLLVAARFFTLSAERIGLALGMSPFAVGVVIVSAGTSLPELVSSIVAVTSGSSEIVVGNVLGANLSNLLLVTGVAAVAVRREIRLGEQYILIDLHFLLGSVLLVAFSLRDGVITRVEGGFLVLAYGAYLVYMMKEGRGGGDARAAAETLGRTRPPFPASALGLAALSAAFIYLGARFTVSSLVTLAELAGVSPAKIAVTVLALGTTLPELVVSASAARAGKADVAVGNVLGSCIFNSLAITGVAALVGRVEAPADLLALPLPAFAACALLFYLLTLDKRISRWEGIVFLILYALFVMEVARIA
jgi:cation:H+ antiporter